MSADGEVLTNAHVIAGATRIQVKLGNSDKTYDAVVVGSDRAADIALLRIQGASNLPTVAFGRSSDLQVGDQVVAIGTRWPCPAGRPSPPASSRPSTAPSVAVATGSSTSSRPTPHQPGELRRTSGQRRR